MPNRQPIKSETIPVVHGSTYTEKSYDSNDRIVDVVFTQANTEQIIDIPLADKETPASFEVISSQGSVYATEEMRVRWTPNKIFLKSTLANNNCKIRIKL